MSGNVRRIFVEKKTGFDIEAQGLLKDLRDNLGIRGIKHLRIINRYDVGDLTDIEYARARETVFSEPPVDFVYDENVSISTDSKVFAVEYLPGQFDQRADSASQCMQILTCGERPQIRAAKLIVLSGSLSEDEYEKIKSYCINPVESQEASLEKPETLDAIIALPGDVEEVSGFILKTQNELKEMVESMGFAMSLEDLAFCQSYFRDEERRNPTVTELRVIDTYWSDHCRHTTFLTNINDVEIEPGGYSEVINAAFRRYVESREYIHKGRQKGMCLMDIATIAAKELFKNGVVKDLDVSDENNACSIVVNVDVDGKDEEWLVMFKNETHNHPTEIEPFGGAATCLGGAIRDPLSGRAYVYQAMRVTGSGDPRIKVQDTIPGKLPQKKITTGAAAGYSSYGNQIGLATGQVTEIYDDGFVAKRMEIGAVIGAVPKKNVVREKPEDGDIIILLGGRTGRDGCGGATGSSKEHNEESILTCSAEVQKGNPPTERKIQRLFRNPEVSTMIKKCNDFGAGGVSVAIGELADSLEINLDAVPKKYEGLDGTELAISESQERMAVVVDPENVKAFISAAAKENLEATIAAHVTADGRLKMSWRGKNIVNISRKFLDTNGVTQYTSIKVASTDKKQSYFAKYIDDNKLADENLEKVWTEKLQDLNICSQKGLSERFDSTIGAGTVTMPFGGKYQLTPSEGMAAKIPVLNGETTTSTIMTYGYNPEISKWSPFHGALYAVVEAVAKIAAMGGNHRSVRLTLQEYFEKLGKDPERWGKPFSALLGAYYAQMKLGIPAIGGKDSMSGTFKDMSVPPTLVAFAVSTANAGSIVSNEFKKSGSKVIILPMTYDDNDIPDFDVLHKNYAAIHKLASGKKVLSAQTVRAGGIAEAISKMCFGNMIGFEFDDQFDRNNLFKPWYGSIILEVEAFDDIDGQLDGIEFNRLGYTTDTQSVIIGEANLDLNYLAEKWQQPLDKIFPVKAAELDGKPEQLKFDKFRSIKSYLTIASPRVFMPVFPGTNCEYDTAARFEKAGAIVDTFVVRNLTSVDIEESIRQMADKISNSQIIMLPGGFSGGDEPDGSGKFIATAFRNPHVKDAVMNLIKNRDGLILGICNGFQALVKLGLLPYGEIKDIDENTPTLTFNTIGRHVSCMVNTRVISCISPWLSKTQTGNIYTIPVSHGEGRFVANADVLELMKQNGQIATQYVDLKGDATYDAAYNPNGSVLAIEGITSPNGKIFGKMGHSERVGSYVAKNVPGDKDQKLFEAGVEYYR